jgi:UDP-N-acetylmuramoylalanine--D-glutamate ligase
MQDKFYRNFFEGKRITKQGFGVLGRGFGVVKFLLDSGPTVTVTDTKPASNFIEQIKALEDLGYTESSGKVKFVFGEHREEDFINCDFVIQASGVPKDNHYLAIAKTNNVSVYQESSLFVKLVHENFKDVKIVGVTGTRGKTTTTFLIYEVLRNYFKVNVPQKQIHLGGNVQGVATLELIKNIKEGDVVVMELDSWILQGFGEIKYSPNISVFTSFMPDHMNYYKGDMKEYFLDKANIFRWQNVQDVFVTTDKVANSIREYLGQDYKFEGQEVSIVSENTILNFETRLLGRHNQMAINLAYMAVNDFDIDEEEFRNIVKEFKGVKGRLEFVKEIKGVRIYNDTCSTTPDATIAGLNAILETLKLGSKIILICGGKEKELDLTNLVNKILELSRKNKLEVIVLNDEVNTTGSKKLLDTLKESVSRGEVALRSTNNLSDAVKQAVEVAKEGDVVLFSPGFTSFGMFKNEYDRGDKFMELVDTL